MVSIAVAVSYSGHGTCGIGIHSSEYGGISILCKQSDEIRLNDSISAVCAIYTASPNTTLTIYGRTSFLPLIHDLERSSPFMDTCVDNKIFNCALRRMKEFGLILEKDRVLGAESVYRLNSARNCARDATKYSLEDVSSSRILFSINEDIVAYVVRSSSEFSNSIYNDNALDCSSTYTVNRKAEFQQSSSTSLALLPKAYASMDLVPDSVVIFVLCMGCTELICIACPRYHNMSQKCFEAEEVDSTIVSTLCRSCSRLQATKTSTVLRRAENGDRYNRDSSICIECFVMNPNYGRVYNVLYEQRKIESHNRVKYIPIDELLDKSDAKCNLFGVVFDEAQPVIQMKNRAAMGFL